MIMHIRHYFKVYYSKYDVFLIYFVYSLNMGIRLHTLFSEDIYYAGSTNVIEQQQAFCSHFQTEQQKRKVS